jgi:alpha,alpha-trehalose-phosphate synthase [UDP-forming]/trehalose-phosphatase
MLRAVSAESEYWPSLARHAPLGILTDLDGTLLPFGDTPDAARPTPEIARLVSDLSQLPNATLVIVSGRSRETLDAFFPRPRGALLVAEHGAWRSAESWESHVSLDERAVDSLAVELRQLVARYPSALIERKTWSLALHFRLVSAHRKSGLLVQVASILRPWLESHPDFERLAGAEVVEIRPRLARKGTAVAWARERLGPDVRLIVVGDDVTDEDMFSAAGELDAPVLVSSELGRPTRARWTLRSPDEVHAFYRTIVAVRRGDSPAMTVYPNRFDARASVSDQARRLLVVSNRLPELRSPGAAHEGRKQSVGGLVSALRPVLERHQGLWLGWSGRTRADAVPTEVGLGVIDAMALAWVDFPEEWQRRYYNGASNSALWPLFHSFPGRVHFSHPDWEAYRAANQALASVAQTIIGAEETVWVHDYHLLLLGKFLRAQGARRRIGFFQHIPFCGPDIFFLLPWAQEVMDAMFDYDLVGFHTQSYLQNFLRCAAFMPGTRVEEGRVVQGERVVNVGVFPLGIIPADFQEQADAEASEEIAGLVRAIGPSRLVLGVDRLDYTKGIPERIDAFGRLLELFPEWRRNVSLVQVSVPSRADIAEYAEQRTLVENSVGRINGEFGQADWVPIRYLYRSYGRAQLSELYRLADVGYVTPLRDGMNLVAKEYVAAQDPKDPGVLLLSRFAGAAEELRDAVLTNPWDPEGTARDLDRVLRMSDEERTRRHASLLETVSRTTALTWAEDFLAALASTRG